MFLLGGIFKVEHLSGLEWVISILIGAGALLWCLLIKLLTRWVATVGSPGGEVGGWRRCCPLR